jgi:hypothetical protein
LAVTVESGRPTHSHPSPAKYLSVQKSAASEKTVRKRT